MKIIIAGAGEVGFHLAKLLSYESHDITLIDTSKQALTYADNHLDILIIRGDATSPTILKEAQVSTTELVIGVTSEETVNLVLCMLAKQLGCKKTVARVSNSEFIEYDIIDLVKMGIDEVISPEYLAAREIQMLINSAFSDTFEFEKGALIMVGTTLDGESELEGKTIQEASLTYSTLEFVTIALQRKNTTYTVIPRGDTTFMKNDLVYFIIPKKSLNDLYKLTGKKKNTIKNVMISGGGHIGLKTTLNLTSEKVNIKLIEIDPAKAKNLSEHIPPDKAIVINGDGCNVELLEEEDFESMDAFISVTGNSETNIMSCLLVKNRGIKKTIALVENTDYFHLSHSIGIDTLINKKLLAADSIFRYVRRGNVIAMTHLNHMDGEILEFVVLKNSKITKKKIKDLDFPRSAIIGGVIRKGKGIIALGDFQIEVDDRVVVCSILEAIPKVEKLFFSNAL